MHKKPTQEELDQQLKKTQEELEKGEDQHENEDDQKDDDESENEGGDEGNGEEKHDDEEKGDGNAEESGEDSKEDNEEKDEEVEVKDQDYKKKFAASSREAQKISAGRRKVNQAIVDASKLPEPTEEDLVKEFPEWEEMTDTEKKLAKSSYVNDRRFKMIETASEDADKIEKWNESVADFIGDPKTLVDNPDLDGKEEAFKNFATQEEYRNTPMKLLVSGFLHELSQNKPAKKKGQMFETGTGGPDNRGEKSKDGKMSLAEANKLMKTNYNEYKKALKAGKIDMSVS